MQDELQTETENTEEKAASDSQPAIEVSGVVVPKPQPSQPPPSGPPRRSKLSTPASRVAEGALLVALATILALVSVAIPLLSFVWPIPIALLIRKHGFGFGCLGLAVTAVLLFLLFGPTSLLSVVGMAGIALWFGWASRKNLGAGKTLFVGVIISGLSTVLTLLLSSGAMGLAVQDLLKQMDESTKMAVEMLKQAGMMNQLPGGMTAEEFTSNMMRTMRMLIPAVLIIISMLEALITFLLTSAIFNRLGCAMQRLPKFAEWHLPWISLWGLIVALAAYIGNQMMPLEWLEGLAVNIFYLYFPILLLTGLSFVFWYANRTGFRFLKVIVIVGLVLMIPFLFYLVLMVGLIDSVFDFRKLILTAEANRKKMTGK